MVTNLTQKEIIQIYSEFVCKPKAEFFSNLGFGVVQGERKGIYIKMLEGLAEGEPPLELIDCHTSGGVKNLGSQNPEILKAIKEGLDLGLDIGDHHLLSEQRALLAKELAKLLPGDISKTMFSVGGGEAIDLAIKLARGYTKREKVISANRAYHGVTGFALGACSSSFKDPFQWTLPIFQQVPFGEIEALRKIISEETACVIFESIPATGGILIPPEGYFAEVRELCDENGVIFIIDEVQTGLGRTGELWAVNGGLFPREKVVPDIMVLAKGMSAGIYPMSTTSYRPFIEEVFENDPFIHISTTGGSELGCFITRRMLDIVSKPKFLNHVKSVGKQFKEGLLYLKEKNGKLIDLRGRGLMWGLEFVDEFTSLYFVMNAIKNGVFCDYCGNFKATSKLLPPLIIENYEIDSLLQRLDKAFKQLT